MSELSVIYRALYHGGWDFEHRYRRKGKSITAYTKGGERVLVQEYGSSAYLYKESKASLAEIVDLLNPAKSAGDMARTAEGIQVDPM